MSKKLINIEVAYALPTKQTIIDVAIHENATVEEGINASNVLEQFPEIDLKATKVGIWSRVVKLRDTLTDGDRIEIYRPLLLTLKKSASAVLKAKEEGRADKVTGGKVNPLKRSHDQLALLRQRQR